MKLKIIWSSNIKYRRAIENDVGKHQITMLLMSFHFRFNFYPVDVHTLSLHYNKPNSHIISHAPTFSAELYVLFVN